MKKQELEMEKQTLEMKTNEVDIQTQMKLVHLESEHDKVLIRANADQLNTFITIPPSHSVPPIQIIPCHLYRLLQLALLFHVTHPLQI